MSYDCVDLVQDICMALARRGISAGADYAGDEGSEANYAVLAAVQRALDERVYIIPEIRGGVLQAIYADKPERVSVSTVVDWDNVEAGDPPPDAETESKMIDALAIY